MGRWGKVSIVSAMAISIAIVTTIALHHSAAAGNSASVSTAGPRASPATTSPAPPPGPLAHAPIKPRYDDGDFKDVDPRPASHELRAWAMLDRRSGELTGSRNSATAHNSTESMIKAWIASDYFRRLGDGKPTTTRLRQIRGMIRDSDDQDAQDVWVAGGGDAVTERLIKVCGLKDTNVWHGWWSRTQITAADAVRMGNCIATGKAAGPKWTGYVLNEMRHVRGEGRFGIVDALPTSQRSDLAIKNGWTAISWDNAQWHVNCLGITGDWVLVVQVKYPIRLGLTYGAGYCQFQAAKVLTEHE